MRPGAISDDANAWIVRVFCPRRRITAVSIDVGEREDRATIDLPMPVTVLGGPGADALRTGLPGDAESGAGAVHRSALGTACYVDSDGDSEPDPLDNCPGGPKSGRADREGRSPSDNAAPTLRVRVARTQRRAVLGAGMPVQVRCSEGCALQAQLTVSRATARRPALAGARRSWRGAPPRWPAAGPPTSSCASSVASRAASVAGPCERS